jgi:hypothetical protein
LSHEKARKAGASLENRLQVFYSKASGGKCFRWQTGGEYVAEISNYSGAVVFSFPFKGKAGMGMG